ncbi:MAG: valine--tRNA ligase [Candidatus Atribacteria bacterium]|nr:valine--tRNA ligase [Candidatus Atribacteria bacterium]
MNERTIISPVFEPSLVEDKWYEFWEKKGYFTPSPQEAPPFSIVIPPPNVTGYLHMGHALNLTLQDILVRYRRMQGYRTVWVPGTDHAGIATQNVVEKQLSKEGLSRHDLGREKFLEKVWEWKESYHERIVKQLKKMGASCDWTRERFTLDEGLSRAVREVFVRLFEEGLIYKDEYIVNWCPRCETALADIEVEYTEVPAHLYYVRYYLRDEDRYLIVATTRPETMLGDVALAVNPHDERYQNLIGKVAILPLVGRNLPIIGDEYVDIEFGTGVLKVTPAHDPHDFELGKKHKLPIIKVIDERGFMNEKALSFSGLSREEAREKVVEKLKEEGYLEKIEDYSHAVGHCYRCSTVVEPLVSKQWFVRVKDLAQPAIEVVKEKKIEFIPERWEKVYFEWMENIKDWCISRQLWWGHRIPVFYCQNCGFTFAHRDIPENCPRCGGEVRQDEDVLDTWFSSALWPFSVFGWPEDTEDLRTFYPTSVLITGFDIIFFWVARMIMMGLKFMGDVPFHKVYITPLVRDAQGKKMSKSSGNAIDPLEIIDHYGADALRFALGWLTIQGRDINLSQERIEASRNFMNKLWNVSRFVLMNEEDFLAFEKLIDLDIKDRWILSRFHRLLGEVEEALNSFDFGQYVQLLYDFVWGEYCDWYVEWSKIDLYRGGEGNKKKTQNILLYLLSGILKVLHPVIPFITEEIWQNLPIKEKESIMIAPWPGKEEKWLDEEAEKTISFLQEVIREIRYLRAELGITPKEECKVILNFSDEESFHYIEGNHAYIESLAKCSVLESGYNLKKPESVATGRVRGADVYLLVEGMVNLDKEVERLNKKLFRLQKEEERIRERFNDSNFLSRAPEEVVEKERRRFTDLIKEKERLETLLEDL